MLSKDEFAEKIKAAYLEGLRQGETYGYSDIYWDYSDAKKALSSQPVEAVPVWEGEMIVVKMTTANVPTLWPDRTPVPDELNKLPMKVFVKLYVPVTEEGQ